MTQIMDIGGLLLRMANLVALRGLCIALGGLIAVTWCGVVFLRIIVDVDYKKSLFGCESDKQKLLD
jgi:hypothetical protein